ncbi:hypothetical protein BC826DRAFT_969304 [Russula brevipes]|nr:hypothetical protein BC826DRAFT_969304 [Russula brevipes]
MNGALSAYEKKTKRHLASHPLAGSLQACTSPHAVIELLQGQSPNPLEGGDDGWRESLDTTVGVLYTFSEVIGKVLGLVFPPGGAIFTGIFILLSAARDVAASRKIVIDIFKSIVKFFGRLEAHIEGPLNDAMMVLLTQMMADVLSILAITTMEVTQRCPSELIPGD